MSQILSEPPKQWSSGHSLFFSPGPAGQLETWLTMPKTDVSDDAPVMIICHPNPLQEGTMHNKVVYTLAKAGELCGLPTLRFNFRGVGLSAGEFGEVQGEIADLMAIIQVVQMNRPNAPLILAGFSFGSYISAYAALHNDVKPIGLLSVAPAVDLWAFDELNINDFPWTVIMGESDEIVDFEAVVSWATPRISPLFTFLTHPTGHFFHGELIPLRRMAVSFLETLLPSK